MYSKSRGKFHCWRVISFSSGFEKQLTKAIINDEVVQFQVNDLESNTLISPNSLLLYSMGSPKAKSRLKNGSKISTLLNTNTEINVIT